MYQSCVPPSTHLLRPYGQAFLYQLKKLHTSVRLGCKIKQMFDMKKKNSTRKAKIRSGACDRHSNLYRFSDQTNCYGCISVFADGVEVKQAPKSPLPKSTEASSLLVKIPGPESSKENSGVMWTSSPDWLEDPRKQFQYSNSSISPCVSESGSNIYSKREVIQKLRQHLKKRDEMIMEMQAQISDLKNSLGIQVTQTANLQSQLDAANTDFFESEREIQHLRKITADCCVAEAISHDNPLQAAHWQSDVANGHANGCADSSVDDPELHCIGLSLALSCYMEQEVEYFFTLDQLFAGKEITVKQKACLALCLISRSRGAGSCSFIQFDEQSTRRNGHSEDGKLEFTLLRDLDHHIMEQDRSKQVHRAGQGRGSHEQGEALVRMSLTIVTVSHVPSLDFSSLLTTACS
ncbi:hypothetical protein GUJ93_ZPchr0010g9097 [Zizania palustris]|uniref:Uncharacterized protein n=1 Tax=Zizania palustris TaxID=103762 RepID=A0A8J5WC64_ZIZPA|nr:hypothetical protein GUJ93_ZPchr0010g9097 [Zizania palustris]